jgi:SHS2 domain-containing protein
MKPYEFKEHTADIIARAYGDTLEEAFAAVARAMFDLITAGADIQATQEHEFEIESIDLEGLLVTFLSDLIVLHETEDMVFDQFQVTLDGEHRLSAICRGEKFDPRRHGGGTAVKGVSYHLMEIEKSDNQGPYHVQVLFDI